jgi:Bacterial Ig-like domain (group 1)
MRYLLLTALACVVALAVASPAFAAEPFGGPFGAEFVANSFDGDRYEFEVDCDPSGVSTVRFSVTGSVFVSYVGTFEESGTFTIGPQTGDEGRGDVLSFEASFAVTSGDTTVTGTKRLVADVPGMGGTATCDPESGTLLLDHTDFAYAVDIQSPSETAAEQGRGNVRLDAVSESDGWAGQMEERFTDVLPGGQIATTIVVEPETAVHPVGVPHEVTATVLDQEGGPIEGTTVRFGTFGAVFAQGECTTDADGRCGFTVPAADFPGGVAIEAFVDANNNGTLDSVGEPTTTAFVEYVLPVSTAGSAVGGGTAAGAAFELNFKSGPEGAKGTCAVSDEVTGELLLECLDVLAYVQSGNTATVYGTARTPTGESLYRITVVDNGEPGRGRDVVTILTADGLAAGGVLEGGNVRIH